VFRDGVEAVRPRVIETQRQRPDPPILARPESREAHADRSKDNGARNDQRAARTFKVRIRT
jgi:hypothetical protein